MRTFASLRHRNYRLFFSGQLVSLIGTWLQSVAQSWLVLQLTNSALALGLVGAAGGAPLLVLSPVGGVVADRFNKHRLIVGTQLSFMVLALALATLTSLHLVRAWHVMIFAAVTGTVTAVDMPARQAFVVEMVGPRDLMNAIALNSTLFNAARVLGPALAGLLVVAVGVAGCFYLNGASYVAVIVALLMMRLPPLPPRRVTQSVTGELRAGVGYIRARGPLLALFGLLASVSLFASAYAVLLPVFAQDVLHTGAAGFGWLTASGGVGALAAALVVASRARPRYGLQLLGGVGGLCLSLLLLAVSPYFLLSALALVGVGFSMVTFSATANTTIQTLVDDEFRGRVMGLYTLVFVGLGPLSSLLGGTLAHWWGVQVATMLTALLTMLTALGVMARHWDLVRPRS